MERLLDLDVAERFDLVELRAELVHERARVGHVPAADDHLDRRGGPRLIVCEIRSPGSKAKIRSLTRRSACSGVTPRCSSSWRNHAPDLLGQDLAQPLLQREDADPAPLAEADAQQAVVGPAAPEVGHVDRELRRVRPGVAHGDVDVLGPDLLGDHVERLLSHLAGQLVVGPLRRPDAELELPRVDPREQLAAQLAAHDDHDGAGRQQVGQHHHATVRDRPVDDPFETVLEPREEPGPARPRSWPWVPWRFSSSQTLRTGTNVLESRYDVTIAPPTASDSGTNSARTGPVMMNDGMNTREDAQERQQPGYRRLHVPLPHGPGHRRRVLHLGVDVLDLDGRLVDQDADRQRQSAQGHDVDRVARQVQDDDRSQQRQRDVEHDDDHGPEVAEEQQDHQPGQPAPSAPSTPTLSMAR